MARPVSTRDACGDLRDKRDDNCSFLDPETVEGIEVGLKAGTAAGVGSGDGESHGRRMAHDSVYCGELPAGANRTGKGA